MDRRLFLKSSMLVVGASMTPALLAACNGNRDQAGALRSLASVLKGQLLLPSAGNYSAESLSANDVFESVQPIAIAICANSDDVRACINWCRNQGVQPGIRGGGHSYIGASSTAGLLIKMTNMNKVTVDATKGTAVLQAGALNRDLLAALRGGDWMLPIGTCPTVGVTGLTLGGGIGDNSRWAGMTADHLTSTDVVTANGELVSANAATNPDLYWACRGGAGGNFGVNTSLSFQLLRVPRRTITVFGFRFHGAQEAAAAWAAFDRLMLTAPVQLSGFTGVTNRPLVGSDSRFATGSNSISPELSIDGCYIGPPDEARDLLRPVASAAKPSAQIVGEMEYWSAQLDWLAVPDMPKHGLAEAARFTNKALPASAISEMISRVSSGPGASDDAYVEYRLMCWSGGRVINGISPTATAYVHRNANSLLRPAIWWRDSPQKTQDELRAWLADQWEYITPFTLNQSFQNWPWEGIKDWQQAYYGQNLARLKDVKKRYDPSNMFRHSQSIPVG